MDEGIRQRLSDDKNGEESDEKCKPAEEYEYAEAFLTRVITRAIKGGMIYTLYLMIAIGFCLYKTMKAEKSLERLYDVILIWGIFLHYVIGAIKSMKNLRRRAVLVGLLMAVLLARESFYWSTTLMLGVVLMSR